MESIQDLWTSGNLDYAGRAEWFFVLLPQILQLLSRMLRRCFAEMFDTFWQREGEYIKTQWSRLGEMFL